MSIRLLALDLDGTLLDPHSRVSPAAARAVRDAQRAGVQVALCSGRNAADARRFSSQLLAPAEWAVTCNGADVRALPDSAPLLSAGLSEALCHAILDACARLHTDPCLYTAEAVYYGREFERFVQRLRQSGRDIAFEGVESYHPVYSLDAWREVIVRERGHIAKAILDHDNPQIVDNLADILARDGRFELAPSVMFGGTLKNVEVNAAGVHKGRALAVLAAHLGVTPDQVMAVGDSDNDLSMLRFAGVSVAMGNAPAHVRRAAVHVTASNAEDGAARAIKRWILGPSP